MTVHAVNFIFDTRGINAIDTVLTMNVFFVKVFS